MDFQNVFLRIKRETEIETLTNLAKLVNTSQQHVSRKKKEGIFPTDWAFKVAQKYGLSTDWIMTGKGPKTPEREVHDSYMVMLEKWLEEYSAPDPRKKALFELTIEREFPEFKEWLRKKTGKDEDHTISKVA
ncbi:MAG: hypothetical protein D3920_00820 [Candidatus Electrothrix sp. AW2]|nr:hypothetical protein [Candidatus Electrothrix gigas]